MRNHFVQFVLLLLIAGAAFACDTHFASAQENTSWESTVVKETAFDFGDVKPGTDSERVVEFKNTSSEPYVIKSVSSSCGCMKAEMEAGDIEPGKIKKLKIRLDTERFIGHRSASIHVLFAKPANREIKLSGKVNIRKLVCEPEEVQFIGGTGRDGKQTRELLIKRIGSPFWQIKAIESSTKSVTATLSPSEINGKEVRYKVSCTLTPDPDASGIQHEKLILKTNDSSLPSYEIPILIKHSARVETSPDLLDFSNVEIGKKKLVIVRFQENVDPDFEIRAESGFEIANSKKLNGRTWRLEVLKSAANATDAELKIKAKGWEDGEAVRILNKPR